MSAEPYYQDDLVTLYHGDCREVTEWLDADVLITDPPYGIGYKNAQGSTVANDDDYAAATDAIKTWGPKPWAAFGVSRNLPPLMALASSRFRLLTWHKSNINGGVGVGSPWLTDTEFCVCSVEEWPKHFASGLIAARRFTGNPACNSSPDAYLHPTQKPIPVMETVIAAMPAGVVADPFAGSASTLRAAKNLGRRAVGVELVEAYCEVAARRLAQDTLFGGVA
jgi:DNA modification methylase